MPHRAARVAAAISVLILLLGCESLGTKRVGVVAKPAPELASDDVVVIAVPTDAPLRYDGAQIEITDLAALALETLSARSASGGDPKDIRFVVAAAPDTEESVILNVMFELSKAGIRNVVFDTLDKS